jgi:hypothetical protein
MSRACGTHTGTGWANLRKRNNLKDLHLDGRIILKLIFKEWDGVWNGLIWLWIGTCVMHL